MLGVVGEAEVPGDELGDAGGSPEFVGPAVGLGLLEEESFELDDLVVGECRSGRRRRDGVESAGRHGGGDPPGDGVGVDAVRGGDGLAGVPRGNRGHRVLAAAFEVEWCSVGSAHGELEGRELKTDSLRMMEAVGPSGMVFPVSLRGVPPDWINPSERTTPIQAPLELFSPLTGKGGNLRVFCFTSSSLLLEHRP